MLSLPLILLTVAGLFVLVGSLQPLAMRLNLPPSVLLAVVGTLIGIGAGVLLRSDLTDALDQIAALLLDFPITSKGFLFIFLPILLFEAALAIDVRRMMDDAAPIFLLAVVAVLVTTAVIGFILQPVSGLPLAACLLVGAIVATTDPAAVIAIFRDLGAPPRLTRLVEGESLLNDAAAIALFSALLSLLLTGREEPIGTTLLIFLNAFAGGALFGMLLARLMMEVVPWLRDSRLAEATFTLALPYLAYILADRWLEVSGVVAVVAAGLVVSALGPSRFTPENRTFLHELWGQLSFWAGSLVFILASMLVPRLMLGATAWDALLIGIVALAALAARALVLFGLLPLLSIAGLAERVSHRFKLVLLWGGLRGAVTLALALAVTENRLLDEDLQRFVAILATGYVLFTLLFNGTTLRPLMHLLRLDRLSPVDQALRQQVLTLALDDVRRAVKQVAQGHRIGSGPLEAVLQPYEQRIREAAPDEHLEQRLSQRDRVGLGLASLAIRERELVLEHFRHRSVSRRILERLLLATDRLIDGTRSGGRLGYVRAARRRIAFSPGFKLAHALHRWVRIDRPLVMALADRFEALLVERMVLGELERFTRRRMSAVLGERVAELLNEVLSQRLAAVDRALDALKLQYPAYADALERRFLRQNALRVELLEYRTLFDEGLIGPELLNALTREVQARRAEVWRRPELDLRLDTAELVAQMPLFEGLDEQQRARISALLKPRVAVPGERLMSRGERGDHMVFISSGAVEVIRDRHRIRLGRGDFVGELALLGKRRRQAHVTTLGYCRLLVLAEEDLRALFETEPELEERIRAVADRRVAMNRGIDRPAAE
jgi:CPA1 family monovalent cation:H+ antiporter